MFVGVQECCLSTWNDQERSQRVDLKSSSRQEDTRHVNLCLQTYKWCRCDSNHILPVALSSIGGGAGYFILFTSCTTFQRATISGPSATEPSRSRQ